MGPKKREDTVIILCEECNQPLEEDEICFCQPGDNVDEYKSINDKGDSLDKGKKSEIDEDTLTQLLITEVRERPMLWDSRISYTEKHPNVIAKIWREIDKILAKEDYSKDRWRYLRNRYGKILNDSKKMKPSGSGADDCIKEITWPYFRSLEFLRPVIHNYRRGTTNSCLQTAEQDDNPSVSGTSVQSCSNSAVTTDSTTKAKKRQRTTSCETSGLGESIINFMNRPVEMPPLQPLQAPPPLDMIDSVTAFFGNVLRSLEPRKRMQLMHKMMQEAMEFQLQQQQEYADEYYY